MHMHSLAGLVLHATGFAVIGFFVLFAASKAEGIVRIMGTLLGWWLWIMAVLVVVLAVMHPALMSQSDDPGSVPGTAAAPAKH